MQRGVAGCAQVPFLRVFRSAFRVDARRWLRWILNSPRRSFKLRVLVDRQRPMKNVTLDRTTVLQLDADGTDSALDAARLMLTVLGGLAEFEREPIHPRTGEGRKRAKQ